MVSDTLELPASNLTGFNRKVAVSRLISRCWMVSDTLDRVPDTVSDTIERFETASHFFSKK